jgi:hypothetical protein
MTPLRHRMIQDLQLRGYADRTIEAYVHAVAQLARLYHASPDTLTEEQIREYLLHLSTVKKVARASHTIALCGLEFFYQQTLGREWTVLDDPISSGRAISSNFTACARPPAPVSARIPPPARSSPPQPDQPCAVLCVNEEPSHSSNDYTGRGHHHDRAPLLLLTLFLDAAPHRAGSSSRAAPAARKFALSHTAPLGPHRANHVLAAVDALIRKIHRQAQAD